MFLVLCFINRPKILVRLPLLLEMLGNMCIAFTCFTGCGILNVEINLAFIIKPHFCLTKKLRQKFKYLENEKRF